MGGWLSPDRQLNLTLWNANAKVDLYDPPHGKEPIVTTLTVQEKAEALRRTVTATQATIDQGEATLADLKAIHRKNLLDLRTAEWAERKYTSPEARFKRAVKALRAEGIAWRTNIRQCCRGCVSAEMVGLDSEDSTEPYAWTFGGQGQTLRWDADGNPIDNRELRRQGGTLVDINWGNGAAEKVVTAFQAEGFEADWNGSDWDTVTVRL